MSRKRKRSAGMSGTSSIIFILLAISVAVPSRWWSSLVVLAGVVGFTGLIMKSFRGQLPTLTEPNSKPEPSLDPQRAVSDDPDFHTIRMGSPEIQFTIPTPRDLCENPRWIGKDEIVTVNGLVLKGGMFYFTEKADATFNQEPSLIDGQLAVQRSHVDLAEKLTGYWPSYSTLSPAARRGYLQWLSDGRRALHADIGYVFIFFYGLERRAIVDSASEEAARSDLPAIVAEVTRLRTLYGHNASFRTYSANLLNHLQLMNVQPRMYLRAPPRVDSAGFELPIGIRIALGQMACDQHPLEASWALAWVLCDPNINHRAPVSRCAEQFAQLFTMEYAARYPAGLVLACNKTLLKVAYRSASSRLVVPEMVLGKLPEVAATSGTRNKLQAIVDKCVLVLDPFSRYLGRHPDGASDLEGMLLLPVALWPTAASAELAALQIKVGDEQVIMTLGELARRFKSAGALSRGKILALARALESLGIGMEPDVISSGRTPKTSDTIVLFAAADDNGSLRTTAEYDAAVVTLDLASAVAAADGEISMVEMNWVGRHIDSWNHLCITHRKRLKAHLQIQLQQPPTLASLKKKLGPLTQDAKRTTAGFLAHLVQANGEVSPQKVRLLERVYKTLQLDPQLLYSDLHGAAIKPSPRVSGALLLEPGLAAAQAGRASNAGVTGAGFNLDMDKIARLQRETAAVSVLLAEVFSNDQQESAAVVESRQEEPIENSVTVHGLDIEHSVFLRLLVSRSEWSREELEDAAADMELMLDGALEQINDMAFERFDMPVAEGDDPIEINPDILEELAL